MAIDTQATIQNDRYGKTIKTRNGSYFCDCGKLVTVVGILENIENQDSYLRLSFEDRSGTKKFVTVSHGELGDNSIVATLAKKGADLVKKHADIFVDTLRLQEEQLEASGTGVHRVFSNLGWITLPVYDARGNIQSSQLCYRANRLIGGSFNAKYIGGYKVSPMGEYNTWKQMVMDEIVGGGTREVLLLFGLSAIINGLIAPETTAENPIIHVSSPSGTGKSSLGYAITSVYGEAFSGQRRIANRDGTIDSKISLYQTWDASEAGSITRLAGNRGAAVVLNELGKLKKNVDVRSLIYNYSEGSGPGRSNVSLGYTQTDTYYTTIISFGEISLLDKAVDKSEGLRVRVMEFDKPITDSAEQSRRIKDVSSKNNGHAAPMLAQHIIDNGGRDYVLPIYAKYRNELPAQFPDTPSKERFIEKFAALLMTTGEIAEAALGIHFDLQSVLQYLIDYEAEHGQERNSAAESYNAIIEQCLISSHKFWHKGADKLGIQSCPSQECWGRISEIKETLPDGRIVLREFEVRPKIVKELLAKEQFGNLNTCIAAWKASGVLNFSEDRDTRKRKVDPTSDKQENVYVFRVFANAEEQKAIEDEKNSQRKILLQRNQHRLSLLDTNLRREEAEEDEQTADAV